MFASSSIIQPDIGNYQCIFFMKLSCINSIYKFQIRTKVTLQDLPFHHYLYDSTFKGCWRLKSLNSFSRSLGQCIHTGWCQCIHRSKAAVLRCPVENLSNSSFGSGYDWLIPLLHWRRYRLAYGPKSEIHLVRMTVDQGLFHTIKYDHTCMTRLLNLLDCTKSDKKWH